MTATTLAEHPALAVDEYIQRFADAQRRLALTEMDASLTVSYDLLPDDLKPRFARLAVFPAAFDHFGASVVLRLEVEQTQNVMDALVSTSLVEWDEKMGRYRLHDLVRDFAQSRLSEAEALDAALRHAGHYRDLVRDAGILYSKGGANSATALGMFERDWAHIRAGQAWAADHAHVNDAANALCVDYPNVAEDFLVLRISPIEQVRWCEAGLAAAIRMNNRQLEADQLGGLANAYGEMNEPLRAVELYEQALAIHRELGDRRGEALTLSNLGVTYSDMEETRQAVELYEQALAIRREVVDRRGEGATFSHLGKAYADMDKPQQAVEVLEQALAIHREVGSRAWEGITIRVLENAYRDLKELRRAAK